VIGHRLNDSLTVYRATDVADGAGGSTRTFASVGTIRAQVSQPSAEERTVAAQAGANLTHVVHTTHGADVGRGDELDTGEGRRLRVLAVLTNSRRTYSRLECEVAQGG
jgi:SPP1 family predicted phage head-tail adaptor